MPDPVSQAVETPPASASTPAAPPPASPPTPSTPPAPDGGNQSPGVSAPAGGTPGATPAPATPSWLSSLKDTGIDFGGDETQALARIAQMHKDVQAMRPLTPYVSQYIQHAKDFQRYLTQQQSQQAQPQPAPDAKGKRPYWSPPEFNQSWLTLVRKDDEGNLVPLPGAPADIVPKILDYQRYQQEKMGDFTRDPFEFMDPHIEARAREIAEKVIEDRFGRQRDQQTAQQFVQEHGGWLYEMDPQTRQIRQHSVFDPNTGQYRTEPVLTQWGQAFASYVRDEDARQRSRGYSDVNEQKRNAMDRVQRDYAVAQLKVLQTGGMAPSGLSPQQQANQQFLQQHNPPAGVPATGGPISPAATPVTRTNLADMLRQNFKAQGITDEVLNQR